MLNFNCRCKVLRKLDKVVVFNNYEFDVYEADVAGIIVPMLISIKEPAEEGTCLISEDAVLTHFKLDEENIFAIRLGHYEVCDEANFEPMANIDVEVRGMLIKTSKGVLRKTGVMGLDFIACTLAVRNEIREQSGILMVAFRDEAVNISKMSNNSILNVKARLRPKKNENDFELNVTKAVCVKENVK